MSIPTYIHDPDTRLDYPMNWGPWLPAGDIIVASVWVTPTPAIVNFEDGAFTDTTTIIFVELVNPVIGVKYTATNRITTQDGRIEDQSIRLKVKEK